jgi:hypothetical protein
MSSGYQLSSGLFDLPETEYNVEYEDYEDAKDSIDERSREVRGLACISDPMMCHYSEAIYRDRRRCRECLSFRSK